ncbi:MAG TPA: penicillin acylase family protein, partial [Gaiellaceae bacterium]
AVALNVLPPGEDGGFTIGVHSLDQLKLYDGLTPLGGNVTNGDLSNFFKRAPLGLGGERAVRTERSGRPGLRILRDRWDVPHVYGRTRADVEFGAGWVTAEDRGFLIELLRGPGRISALDVPGLDAFSLVGSGRVVESSPETEAFLARQLDLARAAGPRGRQLVRDATNYVAGINAYNRAHGVSTAKWTTNDVIAIATLIGAVFGKGGGDEVRRAEFLSALETRLGEEKGLQVWNDLRERLDPEAPVTIARSFPYNTGAPSPITERPIDDGSFVPSASTAVPRRSPLHMSNALLVGAKRSANGHPLFVAGPQVGYYYPQILMELDLHGGGLDARGAAFPGVSLYVLLGRGPDFAWSATSANSDNVDQFVETLCGGDDVHYLFQGECRAMDTFDAGTLRGRPGSGEPDRRLVFRTTVHGPVIGYATQGGQRVAISQARTTRGRELLAALPFQDLNDGRVRSAKTFIQAMAGQEFVFNWFYADDRDIAMFSSGRLPLRVGSADPDLPLPGTGSNEWRGFLAPGRHVQAIDPASGAIVNWNNKPGADFAAADDNWTYGSIQRVDLLDAGIAARRTHTLASVVAAMNRAATQDLRVVRVLPAISAVLDGSQAPSPRAQHMLQLLEAWRASGSSRLDRDLDGKIDDPGAAIMDAAWPRIADAVMRPVLGPLVDRLAAFQPRDDPPNAGGSSYIGGWYGYVDKDLRSVLADAKGQPAPRGAFRTRFCGAGDLAACRASLWAAIDAAGDELAAAQGPDPAAWRADATAERIRFAGFMPNTMRWSNRPTFQQVMTFDRHRPR